MLIKSKDSIFEVDRLPMLSVEMVHLISVFNLEAHINILPSHYTSAGAHVQRNVINVTHILESILLKHIQGHHSSEFFFLLRC